MNDLGVPFIKRVHNFPIGKAVYETHARSVITTYLKISMKCRGELP